MNSCIVEFVGMGGDGSLSAENALHTTYIVQASHRVPSSATLNVLLSGAPCVRHMVWWSLS